uniref:hypothetical protein n=1 Tax=Thaumasiovibrio occultus TaxID=1891184 RepID=UPI00131D3A2A|nr:hypothetical protein [Thaumasiovibrio occultus]
MTFELEPEVAGELGEHTVVDTTQFPPLVSTLHHQFEGWLGDDLLECFPCFLVTAALAQKIEQMALSGVVLSEVMISTSPSFSQRHPNTNLPAFKWLKIIGDSADDFSLNADNLLVVSEAAYKVLAQFSIANCTVNAIAD